MLKRPAATFRRIDIENRLKDVAKDRKDARRTFLAENLKAAKATDAKDAADAAAAAEAERKRVQAIAAEEKALTSEDATLRSIETDMGRIRRELEAEEAHIAAEKPRLAAAGLNALQEAKDAEDALGLLPQPEAKVPRKRARAIPNREDSARQQQIEILEEALNPLSTNIKRALFEMGQQGQAQAQGVPPPYISSWTEKSIMAPVNEGASTVPILKGVLKKALGSIGTNRQGNAPNKKELFNLIRKHSLAQELADAVIAAGR